MRADGRALEKVMKSFLLPCGCGGRIPVGPGQAGGQVRCERCGSICDVPRLGDLAQYAVPESAASAPPRRWTPRRWTIGHACVVGGCAVAVVASVAAAFLASPTSATIDVAGVREAVSRASAGEVYRVWNQIARNGVARSPLPHERRLEQVARVAGSMARWLAGLAVLGGVVAAASAVTLVFPGPPGRSGP